MNDDRIRPADVYRETGQWIGPALVVGLSLLGVGAVIVLCGWLIGGWFQSHDVQRNYSNTVNSRRGRQPDGPEWHVRRA